MNDLLVCFWMAGLVERGWGRELGDWWEILGGDSEYYNYVTS